ncbi:hypothetical protein Csa_016777 [Cucumis sativus]|nr:hypothetical protein Csa_016777 [Cucumis sativus]
MARGTFQSHSLSSSASVSDVVTSQDFAMMTEPSPLPSRLQFSPPLLDSLKAEMKSKNFSSRTVAKCVVELPHEMVHKDVSPEANILRYSCSLSGTIIGAFEFTSKCPEGLQSLKQERTARSTEAALISQRSIGPNSEHLQALHLTSNQELLKKTIAVEKERIDAESNNATEELHHIIQIVDLIIRIPFRGINGVSVPSYFHCPIVIGADS